MGEHDRENALAVRHMPHVGRMAARLCMVLPRSIDREDLVSAGYVGLVQASRSFKPSVGATFMGYAYRRVRGAMLDWLRRNDWFPRGEREKLRKGGRSLPRVYSLEAQLDLILEDGTYEELDCLASHAAPPERKVEDEDFWESPHPDVAGQDLRILQLYFRDGLTARQVGAIIRCSESNIHRILAYLRLRMAS